MAILLTLLKNPKNILIAVLCAVAVALFLSAGFYKYRTESLSGKLKTAEMTTQAQAEQLKQYRDMIQAIKESHARIQAISVKTDGIAKQIAAIKIEGRCIKDETFYNTAGSISKRFNGVRDGSR